MKTSDLVRQLDTVLPDGWHARLFNSGGGCWLIEIAHHDLDYTGDTPSMTHLYINESDEDFFDVLHFDPDPESTVGEHFEIGRYTTDWCEPDELERCIGVEHLAGQALKFLAAT